ncbi:hypothetical protein [Clostridium intestinale]|uniref:hypothetical protein n=1 Tax=Clostridium intestinale TaxID=36845 RepID=UPI0028EE3C15|nr:hypothetical protein [Clostridium intestinale]
MYKQFEELPKEVQGIFKEQTKHLKPFLLEIIKITKEDIIDNYFNYKIYAKTNVVLYIFKFKFNKNGLYEITKDSVCKDDIRVFIKLIL